MPASEKAILDVENAVRQRYSLGAKGVQAELCCPVTYDPKYLEIMPQEVLERDYGCGDPSRHLRQGETVLDLGSGAGKICFIASQIVGQHGRVIGIDMNDDMLSVARRNLPEVARRVGYSNVEFRKGKIQDLALDLDALEHWLKTNPVCNSGDLSAMEAYVEKMKTDAPLVASDSVDVVVSNCVLNLVKASAKEALFGEIYRVLRRGGRAVISDIVSDEDVPGRLQSDPELWSGCISGALREDQFLEAFEAAGFYGISILERQRDPWRIVEGIEFRSVTVVAYKGKEGPCWDHKQAVIYKGPFKQVVDDDGHVLRRGLRVAVCEKTLGIYSREPYASHFELVEPFVKPPQDELRPFPCTQGMLLRDPRETKGRDYQLTTVPQPSSCGPNGGCC
ncbi:MAG TPA: methyltransferase domain-containing protein [Candidatus Saccharimonadales bacterium]|jgi:arsenite methyltransferase|nr:methyltransferase domain-containing protein [Candidatus Saccharimonadales bacterium]